VRAVRPRTRLHVHLFAASAVVVAVAVRVVQQAWLPDVFPFLAFFLAVIAASAYGGFEPGVLAALLSVIAAYEMFSPDQLRIGGAAPTGTLVRFLVVGIVVAWLNDRLRSARFGQQASAAQLAAQNESLRDADRARQVLLERERLALADAVAARDRLAFLADIGALLSSSLDYQETLDRAVHLALPRLGDFCNVLIEDEHGRLRHAAWGHVVAEKEPAVRELVRHVVEVAGRTDLTFADVVMRTAKPVVVGRDGLAKAIADVARKGVGPEMMSLSETLRPYAYAGVPLLVRGRAIGVMSFGTSELESRREYAESDVALVEEFARRVSTAIENARLFRQADELNRLKDEFLATLSHELRTPLSAILGWARMLAAGQLDDQAAARAIQAIERNAQAQSQLVDDILDVARGMAGNLRLDVAPVDLVAVAHRSVEAIAPAAAAKRLEVAVDAPAPVIVAGDAARLQQVVWNILSNAVKFTNPGGRVTTSVSVVKGHAEVSVADTGIGIAPAFLPFVFDKFRQADGSYARRHGGLGLGLAIARHLVELHGGSIEARSDGEDRGSTFTVRLPLPPASIEEAIPAAQHPDSLIASSTVSEPLESR
jgi:signal transduction histidine kinase